MVLVLVETAAGYGLFKVTNSSILSADADDIRSTFETSEGAKNAVELQAFQKFKSTKEALNDTVSLVDSQLGSKLKKFLKRNLDLEDKLAVADKQLGSAIKKKFKIGIEFTPSTQEVIKGIRQHLVELVSGLSGDTLKSMTLSLAHTLARFKLKFSPDKIDTMVVQAVGLLDDLDKELNNFAMRLKEWYGFHFPELPKIVTDNAIFAKAVKAIGFRRNCKTSTILSDVLPEEIYAEVRQAAEISMGTDITQDDLDNINELADRVIELSEYRSSLAQYLKFRMEALAPNLTIMVGELVGARLLAHAGSLMNLAKHPASTVQLLGAEKALFRALKAKQATPKYGLIYHASLVGQSAPALKGKVSRVLAAKLALCIRVDALAEQESTDTGMQCKEYVERRLSMYQNDITRGISRSKGPPQTQQKYMPKRLQPGGGFSRADDVQGIREKKRTKYE